MLRRVMINPSGRYLTALFISLLVFVVYLPVLWNDFVLWDDDVYVLNNLKIRSLDLAFFKWALTDVSSTGFWHPLVWISYALDYSLWALKPTGYHLTNILLHAANTLLVILLLARLLEASGSDCPTDEFGEFQERRSLIIAAGISGLLFGLHPLHAESVIWISERKDLLCALFYLASLIAYSGYALPRLDNTARRRWNSRYLMSLAFFVLALSSKSMAVTLPAVLLLMDWYPFRRGDSGEKFTALLIEKAPFLILSLVVSAASLIGQKAQGALAPLGSVSVLNRLLVASKALVMYLWKMLLPVNLMPVYPYPKVASLLSVEYLVSIALVCAIAGGCLITIKRRPVFSCAFGYYLIAVIPVIGIVPVGIHYMADRYSYLPSLGPFMLVGLGGAWAWQRLGSERGARLAKWFAVAFAVTLCGLLSYLTIRGIYVWRNSVSLWSYVIEKEPAAIPVAYNNRGIAYKEMGLFERAVEDFTVLIKLDSSSSVGFDNRGVAYREMGELSKAIEDHTAAISMKPGQPESYNGRGLAYKELGRHDLAIKDFNTAISLAPDYADAFVSRGWTYKDIGQTDRALEDYNTALRLNPAHYIAFNNRGMLYRDMGLTDLAIGDFSRAVQVNAYFAEAYVNRGLAYEQTGQISQAVEDYTSAMRANPYFANAYNNRGLLFERMGRPVEALADLDAAVRLKPGFEEAYNNRGLVNEDMGKYDKALEDYGRAIELRRDNPLAYGNRGIVFGKMGRHDLAERDFRRACELGDEASCDKLKRSAGR